jgi:beta-galactosidase
VLPGDVLTLDTGQRGRLWSERSEAVDAEVLSRFADGPSAGDPAITRRAAGRGSAWYVATALEAPDLADLAGRVLADAGVATDPALAAAGVERVVRAAPDGRCWTFLVNHSTTDVVRPARGHELVTDTAVTGELVVPARAVRVLREEPVR